MDNNNLGFTHRFVPGQSGFTLLLLHGTGGTETDLLSLGQTLAPGAALLSPRGKVLENGMPRFFRRLAEGVFDEEDLKKRTHELADFIEAAAANYELDPQKIIAVGYSNGANIAASLLLLRPEILSGAVLLRSMVPLNSLSAPDLSGVPVLMASGRFDPIVPQENAERLAAMLRQYGADVNLRWQNGGHGLENEEIVSAKQWLSQVFDNAIKTKGQL